jgi:hypothetical protein
MKKFLLLIALLLPLVASAARPAKRVSKSEVTSLISDFRQYDGVEVVKMGWLGTALLKGVARHADGDEDMQELRKALRGLKNVTVMEYEEAAPDVRARLDKRISRVLERSELLMEARDGGTGMQLFGVVDDASGTVRDLVMHSPDNCMLICLFGTISMDAVGKLMAE